MPSELVGVAKDASRWTWSDLPRIRLVCTLLWPYSTTTRRAAGETASLGWCILCTLLWPYSTSTNRAAGKTAPLPTQERPWQVQRIVHMWETRTISFTKSCNGSSSSSPSYLSGASLDPALNMSNVGSLEVDTWGEIERASESGSEHRGLVP